MEGRGSRFPLLAGVCGIALALVVLLAVSTVANAHCCVFCQCDFYCRGHTSSAPRIWLFKKGDHKYRCDLIHRIEGQRLRVKVANSYKCALAEPKLSHDASDYLVKPCHHNLYTNGDDVASGTFNWGPVGNGKFLNTCIKVHIGSAQYKDGDNYNEGKSNPRSCVMVQTRPSFR